jgi:hypothetical protein
MSGNRFPDAVQKERANHNGMRHPEVEYSQQEMDFYKPAQQGLGRLS